VKVSFMLNGKTAEFDAAPNESLFRLLRRYGVFGLKYGDDDGQSGADLVLLDGVPMRSCLMFAVQADGHQITTVEGLASPQPGGTEAGLHPIQQAFWEAHGLQCGYCTPGILMTLVPFLKENPEPSEDEIRHALSGNLCRCTGYQHIVDAVKLAAEKMR